MTSTEHLHRIRTIFNDALDRSPEDWDDFLDTACSDDPSIRKSVNEMLAPLRDKVSEVAYENTHVTSAIFNSEPATLIGKKLGTYWITGIHRVLSIGTIYEALGSDAAQTVWIQSIKPKLAQDPKFLQRFLTEVLMLQNLNDSRIIDVETINDNDGFPLVVMERTTGLTLADYIQNSGKIGWEEAVSFCRQCLEVLDTLHQKGVMHRDIRPSNILVNRGPDGLQVTKLINFGWDRIPHPGATLPQMGGESFRYLAPEHMLDLKKVDHRSDLYGVGITFKEIIKSRKDAPAGFSTFIKRAIAHDITSRYQSVDEMLKGLFIVEQGGEEPVGAMPPVIRSTPAITEVEEEDIFVESGDGMAHDTEAEFVPRIEPETEVPEDTEASVSDDLFFDRPATDTYEVLDEQSATLPVLHQEHDPTIIIASDYDAMAPMPTDREKQVWYKGWPIALLMLFLVALVWQGYRITSLKQQMAQSEAKFTAQSDELALTGEGVLGAGLIQQNADDAAVDDNQATDLSSDNQEGLIPSVEETSPDVTNEASPVLVQNPQQSQTIDQPSQTVIDDTESEYGIVDDVPAPTTQANLAQPRSTQLRAVTPVQTTRNTPTTTAPTLLPEQKKLQGKRTKPQLIGSYADLQKKLRYLEPKLRKGGEVLVEFTVNEEGSVEGARVIKGLDASFDREVLNIVRALHYRPGTEDGRPRRTRIRLPLRFRSK